MFGDDVLEHASQLVELQGSAGPRDDDIGLGHAFLLMEWNV